MGGIGSGRQWPYSSRQTTEDLLSIDIRQWHKKGMLIPGQSAGWQWTQGNRRIGSIVVHAETTLVVLEYRHTSQRRRSEPLSYTVQIEWADCRYGGQRPWFRCPAVNCNKRVALLYGGRIFACRHCHGLIYPSQREHNEDRATRRAVKLRQRLSWFPGVLDGEGPKPKGMHWETFGKLLAQHNRLVAIGLSPLRRRAILLGDRDLMGLLDV